MACWILLSGVASGGVILWATEDWPDPDPVQVFQHTVEDVDGADVGWQFSGDTQFFHDTSPDDTNRLRGGGGASNQSLLLRWRPDSIGNQVSLQISFDHPDGVENAQMQLYGIDRDRSNLARSQWGDRVTVTATTSSGATVNPSFSNLGSAVAVDGANSLIGLNSANNNSANGNALVSFSESIVSIELVFQDMGVGDFRSGRDHEIGVASVAFTPSPPIPEPAAGIFLLVAAGIAPLRRRRRR